MKRILVTGGAGFLGSALSKRLQNENCHVIVLDNFSSGVVNNLVRGVEVVKGSVSDNSWMGRVDNVDYIFHFASPSSVVLFRKSMNQCLNDTIIGASNVFEFAKKHKVMKVIYPSSSSVYGNTPLPQAETTPTLPVNIYGVAKLACEHLARLYLDDIPSVGLRIFAGYGPGELHKNEIASVITLFTNEILAGRNPVIFGNGCQTRDFVYIDDIVEAAIRLIDSEYTGVLNVGSGEAHSFKDVVKRVNDFLGTDLSAKYIDRPNSYFEHTLADTRKMERILGFSPMSFEKSLEKYFEARLKNV